MRGALKGKCWPVAVFSLPVPHFTFCPSAVLRVCCESYICLLKPAVITSTSQETCSAHLTTATVCINLGSPGRCRGAPVPSNAAANSFKCSASFLPVSPRCRSSQDRGYGRGVCLWKYAVLKKLLFQETQFTGLGFVKYKKGSGKLSTFILRSLGVNREHKECLPNLLFVHQHCCM